MGEYNKRFLKGLFKDTAHIDQPEGTWRHARNMLLNSTDGAVSNEGGTKLRGKMGATSLSQNYKLIGAIEVNDDKVILFLADVVSSIAAPPTTPLSEIAIWEKGVYTIIYNPTPTATVDLNFREMNPIEGTFKINSKGDLVVYWTDDLNPPRAFNIDRQLNSGSTSLLYGIPSLSSINLLSLFPYSGLVPTIKLGEVFSVTDPTFQTSVVTGGGLLTGAYHLALAYVDVDNVATSYLTVSFPVSIVAEFDSIRPTTKKDGDKEGTQTSKSISWEILDVNSDYKYIRPVVIRKMGDAIEAYRLNDIEIDLNSATPPAMSNIVFSSLENVSPASVEDVIIDTVSYETAKTVNQLDGVLYLGNLTGSKDVGFQKYANNIKLKSKIYKINKFDEYWATVDGLHTGFANSPVDEGNLVLEDRSYRYIPNASNYRGYQRDEIYAFYLAFIMKDGSMSYAYHIPGREPITTGVDYSTTGNYSAPGTATSEIGDAATNLQNSYSKTAKMYQFYDTTTFMPDNATRVMQYWENQNEVYPKNENYEVWDSTDTQVGTIQGKNVRHHHFPSNENTDRCSVSNSINSVVIPTVHDFGDWDAVAAVHYQGTFYSGFANSHTGTGNFVACNTGGSSGNTIYGNSGSLTPVFTGAASEFTATSAGTIVRVSPLMRVKVDGGSGRHGAIRLQKWTPSTGWVSQVGTNCTGANQSSWSTPINFRTPTTIEERILHGIGHAWAWEIPLLAGEKVRLLIYGSNNKVTFKGVCGGDAFDVCNGGGWCFPDTYFASSVDCNGGDYPVMWSNSSPNSSGSQCPYDITCAHVKFNVTVDPNLVDLADYRDVKVSHQARALGFRLSDIHIPQTIADKVQGFRIFRAKREHSNRTILGQSIGIPMEDQFGIIGLCNEATGNANAMQNLSVASGREEFFLNKNPWAKDASEYPNGYESISFHDFYLLRTKNSLSPATHLKIEYKVKNFTWNGPDLDQDKKMLTEITTSGAASDSGAYKVAERWGWDDPAGPSGSAGPSNSNCYPQKINSAIFIGNEYSDGSTLSSGVELNRALGQKSKSYIQGDSIFGAEALGFGGKVVNLSGESSIILGLADNSALPVLTSTPDDGGPITTRYFGFNHENGAGPLLVSQGYRSESYILNLKAYKTDVYKSIDSNELVFTGFEVKGEDLNNFIIGGSYGSASADFTTDTVQLNSNSVLYKSSDNSRGIFGGDIFLARYGFASALSPQNTQQLSNPLKAVYSHIVESSDNIALRHAESKNSEYFPSTPATEMLKMVGTENGDFTHQDNIKYNPNYSTDNDIKPAFPLPVNDAEQDDFPTRAHRSAKNDTTSFIDNYRIFLANQFKDLPKNRGELWKLSTFNNLLYFHMEESLYAAKGKQSMSMKDGSEAFVGSGDIFQQDPDEIMQTKGGFGGTESQYAALTTRYGYFFVNKSSRKVFLMQDKLSEISSLGMEEWFADNMEGGLDNYGSTSGCFSDNPVLGVGFHSVYDPKYKRILLTKRDLEPTVAFITGWNQIKTAPASKGEIDFDSNLCRYVTATPAGLTPIEWSDSKYFTRGGWTISYYPELGVWGGFHDYIPYIYFNNSTHFYSLTDQYPRPVVANTHGTVVGNGGIWEHNAPIKGLLYQSFTQKFFDLGILNYYPFEFEFIHNELKIQSNLLFNFEYTADVYNSEDINILQNGFTSYFLYNSFQASGESVIEYLINTRYIGNSWKINNFRDMAAVVDQTGNTTTGLNISNTSTYYMSTNPNVMGGTNVGTLTTSTINNMFIYNGMYKDINPLYLDLNKSWDQKRKFIDKWVGIRLIYDNITNNLLNLYSTSVSTRKASR